MYYRYLCIFLCLFQNAFGQSYYKDVVAHKVTVNYGDHNVNAFVKPVKSSVYAEAGKEYYWYSANRIHITQGGYSGKLLNGAYSDYYSNKNLKEQGFFTRGLKNGQWKSWSPDGKLKERISWKHGKMSGRFYRYDPSGRLKEEGRYRQGLLTGRMISYSGKDSGVVSYYKAGNPVLKTRKNIVPAFIRKLYKSEPKEKKNKE